MFHSPGVVPGLLGGWGVLAAVEGSRAGGGRQGEAGTQAQGSLGLPVCLWLTDSVPVRAPLLLPTGCEQSGSELGSEKPGQKHGRGQFLLERVLVTAQATLPQTRTAGSWGVTAWQSRPVRPGGQPRNSSVHTHTYTQVATAFPGVGQWDVSVVGLASLTQLCLRLENKSRLRCPPPHPG